MNYFIQRGKVRSQVINVPEGLPEILSDITREVLRCQPTTECLCQFIIDYLHSVIVARDKARIAKGIIDRALMKVDEIISDMCICNIPAMKAEQMALVMEECFKHFLAKRRCEIGKDREIIKFAEVDILDELINRCKFSNEELKVSRPVIEAAYQRFADVYMSAQAQTEGTEALYQYFREREMKRQIERQEKEAATKIQAVIRGFLVRRSLFSEKRTSAFKIVELSEDSLNTFKEQEEAARKIQKFFRSRVSQRRSQVQALMDPDTCSPGSVLDLYEKTARETRAHMSADMQDLEASASTTVVSIKIADAPKAQAMQKSTHDYPIAFADDVKDEKVKEETIKQEKEEKPQLVKDVREEEDVKKEDVVEAIEIDDNEPEVVVEDEE